VTSVPIRKARKPRPLDLRSKINRLAPAVRAELDQRIAARNFNSYRDLKVWLRQHGCLIATVSVQRYANKLEQRLVAVRLATEQARAVVEAANDDDVDMNEALLRLVQQHLFTVLVELKGVELDPANLPALARSVAALGRASILQKKYADEIRFGLAKKVAEAAREVDKAAARGLTEDGARQIKRVLMEITE
jgi:Protein of unknown function (DUF3486)